tara:strand:+ start:55 stop:402 length:348 start_codon:yes stop_codon:yes gene_type:complete
MYEKQSYDSIKDYHNKNSLRFIHKTFHENTHMICNENGEIYRKMKSGYWKKIENKKNHIKGYNVILIDKKQYTRAKIIMYFLEKVDLCDKKLNICHINQNKLDCSFKNLCIKGNN